jgi:restriction system protein
MSRYNNYSPPNFPYATHTAHIRSRQMAAILQSIEQLKKNSGLSQSIPGILLQAVVIPGEKVPEGQLVEAVAIPWFEIIRLFVTEPDVIYQLDWRKWEEIIAGAYKQQGFDVVLTPRSNDKGRDIIATSQGVGCIRYFDQVKAYGPNNFVTADDVRAMIGVLTLEPNVSKGIITTTSDFAPGILEDDNIKRLMPYRLELKPRDQLLDWLASIATAE